MDILRFLPNNEYQAATNANSPTGANPFATIADISLGLPAVLAIDNKMLDADSITSLDGKASLIMRNIGVGISWGTPAVDTVSVLDISEGQSQMFLYNSTFTKFTRFGVFDNDLIRNFTAGATDQYPGMFSSRGATLNAGVVNAIVSGGRDVIMKSNDFNYVNGVAFNTGLAGEMKLVHTPNASDFTATLKAESGTIAYLTDIPATPTTFYSGNGSIVGNRIVTVGANLVTYSGSFGFGMTFDTDNQKIQMSNGSLGSPQGNIVGAVGTTSRTWTFPTTKSGTVAMTSDVTSIYSADGTIGAGRVATLTDSLTFTDGSLKIIGANNTISTNAFVIENSDNKLMFEQTDSGNTYIGTHGLGRVSTSSFTVGLGPSNDSVNFWAARAASAPAVNGDNISLNYTLTNSAGNPESHSTIFHYVRSVVAGSAWSRQVINGGLHTEQPTSTTSRTLIANQPDFFGSIAGVCHIRNTDATSTTVACLVDTIRQDNLASALIVRSGVAAGDFNWNLKTNHEFTHNIAQLATGDFRMRGLTDANAFIMDASTDRVGIGVAAPASKLTVSGDVETLTNTRGFIVLDRTDGNRYRIYTDGGVLFTELA